MKQDCGNQMEKFLSLDKGERIPFSLTMHLLSCKKCRAQVQALGRAEKISSEPLKVPVPVTDESIARVLESLPPSGAQKKSRMPIPLWIMAGVIIIATLFVFSLLLNRNVNGRLEFITYLSFAFLITAYCVSFLVANLDFFVKKTSAKPAA